VWGGDSQQKWGLCGIFIFVVYEKWKIFPRGMGKILLGYLPIAKLLLFTTGLFAHF
jgi:hypothetical protein